jgi:hypothetical protein
MLISQRVVVQGSYRYYNSCLHGILRMNDSLAYMDLHCWAHDDTVLHVVT